MVNNDLILDARLISKSYGSFTAISSADIKMHKGKVLGLLGENGAGKSTVISMLTSKSSPDSGEIYYKGIPLSSCLKEYRSKLGYVPQEIALFDELNGFDNLRFWGSAYGLKKDEILSKIEELSELFGLKEQLYKKAMHYSGGYQRRLNIACALLHEPEIIFLDEPTVGIDAGARREIIDIVKLLALSGVSILYTSHYIDEIEEIADSVVILKNGRVVLTLDSEELSNTEDLERFYLGIA